MEQLENVKKILVDVGNKIERSKEIARLKGENFNIFSILGVETKENRTHSNFLASLLNPKGEHGLNDTFLQLFYDTIIPIVTSVEKQKIINKLRSDTVTVKTEDTDGIDAGRVDISIRSKNGIIFMENKIYAGDQNNQIAKYSKNHKEKNKLVFYLTLYGKSPSNESLEKKDSSEKVKVSDDFFLLSYQTDVINWLEKCQKEAADYPIIRETIKQYLILIKKLTGQLTTQIEMNEIHNLIKENYLSAITISNNIEEVKIDLIKNLIIKITESLEKKLDGNWKFVTGDVRKKWEGGFQFSNESWEDVQIGWKGNPYLYKSSSQTVIGIIANKNLNIRSELEKHLRSSRYNSILQPYKKSTDGWIKFRVININDDDYIKLSSKNSFENYMEEIVKEMCNLAMIVVEFYKKKNNIKEVNY